MTTATTNDLGLATGTWVIDPIHSEVGFTVRHLMVSKVRGSFEKLSGTITVAPNLLDSAVHAEIDATSIRTGQDQRDAHLRSGDFFDTENHPNFIFQSTGVTQKGSDFELAGDLSIRGVSRPVVLALEFNGVGPNSQGGQHAGFSATTEISRKDYGVEFNIPLEGGGVTIGDKVTINLEIAADLQA